MEETNLQNEINKLDSDVREYIDVMGMEGNGIELKIRDYIDKCIDTKLNQIKDRVIDDLIRKMEEDYRELASYCENKETAEAVEEAVVFTKNCNENGKVINV